MGDITPTQAFDLGLALIIAGGLVLIMHVNLARWRERKRMTPEQRRAEDEAEKAEDQIFRP